MPKPPLPDEKRKDYLFNMRFNEAEKKILFAKAKKRNCRTISEYIRKLISEDKGTKGQFDLIV